MIRVLLADDHSFMRAGVEAVLRGTRYSLVETVADGEESLAAVARCNPDVCIFDVRMPGRDGVSALEAMRESGDERPVVMLTAELTDRSLYAAIKSGVNGIVLKNGAEDSLIECLDKVVAGGRAIDVDLMTRARDLPSAAAGSIPWPASRRVSARSPSSLQRACATARSPIAFR